MGMLGWQSYIKSIQSEQNTDWFDVILMKEDAYYKYSLSFFASICADGIFLKVMDTILSCEMLWFLTTPFFYKINHI